MIGINYGEYTLSGTLAAGSAGDETTITLTTGPNSEDVADLDDKEGAQIVLWALSATLPHLDSDKELMSVVNVSGSGSTRSVTVIRGREGTSAAAHSTGGETYIATVIFSTGAIQTSLPYVSPQMFGADEYSGSAVDVTVPIRRMASYALKHGNKCRIPPGDFYVTSTIDFLGAFDYGGGADGIPDRREFSFSMEGAGREGGTTLLDRVPGGNGFEFVRPTNTAGSGPSAFAVDLEGITFKNDQQSTANKNTKMGYSVLYLEKITHFSSHIHKCSFRASDANQKQLALARAYECFFLDFDRCYFDGNSIGGLARVENPTINGGEIGFPMTHFNNIRGAAIYMEGAAVCQNIDLRRTKCATGSGGAGHILIGPTANDGDISTFTSSATEIDIGASHSVVPGDVLFIGNDDRREVVYVKSYASTTGLVTIETGLVNDYSSDTSVELVVGPCGFVCGNEVRGVDASGYHTEGVSTIIFGCVGFVWPVGTATGTTASKLSGGAAHHVYAGGNPCWSHHFGRIQMDTVASSGHLVRALNSSGSANVPGPFEFAHCMEAPNLSITENPSSWQSTQKAIYLSSDNWLEYPRP